MMRDSKYTERQTYEAYFRHNSGHVFNSSLAGSCRRIRASGERI